MRDIPQWVCWRHEERGGKTTKVPYSPTTGKRARTDDPATWATLAEARRSAPDYSGIGFVFTNRDPFCGVDLDGRPHADGTLQAEVRRYYRKDGQVKEQGPYWYFRYHEDGRQKKLYLGKTEDPAGELVKRRNR